MIYCVEDDAGIRNLEVYALRAAGLDAEGFADGAAFLDALESRLPELVLLDVMLPGQDGMQLLRLLRQNARTRHIPVIMATARGTEYDKVTGLDLGADDYMAKPFGMMEMVSRVRAVLRRAMPEQVTSLTLGGIVMDLESHTVTAQGQTLELTLKEFDLLRLLLEHPGRVYTRDQLLNAIWDADFLGETRTVDVHIGTLRTKLGICGGYIRTVRGVGYKMEALP